MSGGVLLPIILGGGTNLCLPEDDGPGDVGPNGVNLTRGRSEAFRGWNWFGVAGRKGDVGRKGEFGRKGEVALRGELSRKGEVGRKGDGVRIPRGPSATGAGLAYGGGGIRGGVVPWGRDRAGAWRSFLSIPFGAGAESGRVFPATGFAAPSLGAAAGGGAGADVMVLVGVPASSVLRFLGGYTKGVGVDVAPVPLFAGFGFSLVSGCLFSRITGQV